MKINTSKCNVMLFNRSRKYDFLPEVRLNNNEKIQVTESIKLLGVTISSDLRWHENTHSLSKRGNSRLWLLRRLKGLGAPRKILMDLYNKQIRSIIEYAVPVWSPGLTSSDIEELERIQKSAFNIIFGDISYHKILSDNKLVSLNILYSVQGCWKY